ncbi:GrpB family protein [Amycolatopsis sp. FDAARGOS 1241]|uniref:GrpB family protein n=1 Tax=Amycolatopsis sp. FDAARGOS 1241 TaxID=2778070 RepID=UPI00194F4B26|nr:GrpB family protein [Amycolatopsis sp. FDAARGOS 1241]QRP43839.1 GrpB family protein [Amycolatopsis sp. FDAARGOS 1241]
MPATSQPPHSDEEIQNAWVDEAPRLDSTVHLAEYDPRWPALFEGEAERIRAALGERVLLLEHVGSTSVPGLAAKPIIDILLEVPDSDDEPAYLPALEAAGYRLVIREPEWEKHRALSGSDPRVNLHVHSPGNGQTERYLLFRDRLRAHPEELATYLAKKRELAAKTWRYIQNYADAKSEVIDEIIARARAAQYDEFSQAYADHAAKSVTNALYDRPAIVELAGDVAGKRVLDAGCAAGHLSALLAARGADVLGLDVSQGLISLARKEFGAVAEFEVADLAQPLSLEDSSVDVVTASLVLHYLADFGPALREFHRVLRPGGLLVFSVHHPGEDWHWFDRENYFETELLDDEFPLGSYRQRVQFYRRPLSETFDAVRDAGFTVDRLVEPQPVAEADEADPRVARLLRTKPRFLYFRCVAGEQ